MKRTIFWLTIAAIVTLAAALVHTRHQIFNVSFAPHEFGSSWEVEFRVRAEQAGSSAQMQLALPQPFGHFEFPEQGFQFPGFDIGIYEQDGFRFAALSRPRRTLSQEEYFYRFIVTPRSTPVVPLRIFQATPSAQQQRALRPLVRAIESLDEDSDVARVRVVHRPVSAGSSLSAEDRALLRGLSDEERILLLRLLGVDALYRYGLVLDGVQRGAVLRKALLFRERSGNDRTRLRVLLLGNNEFIAAESFLPWGSASSVLTSTRGLENLETRLSVMPRGLAKASRSEASVDSLGFLSRVVEFTDFGRLSVHSQTIFRILLLLPLAALIITFFRNMVGISTFGTFMPALLALSFRETGLVLGLLLAVGVLGVGVSCRFLLQRLQLLMVPRLTAILTTVVAVFYLVALSSTSLDFHRGQALALFPVVVLTMMVERLSIVWEELGFWKGMVQTAWTLFATICAYLVVTQDRISYLFSSFPELLLVVLSLSLLMGRYTGFRLSELYRFRALRHTN